MTSRKLRRKWLSFFHALFSASLFQFMWTYNDYFNSLVFINSATKYTVSLGLRLSLDGESVVNWGKKSWPAPPSPCCR